MERLTEKVVCNLPDEVLEKLGIADVPKEGWEIKGANGETCRETCEKYECDNCPIKKAIDKLAEYEQAEEDGVLIKLPCRVGDTLYTFNLIKNEVLEFRAESEGFIVDILKYGLLGKTTFLTKAEAEQTLAKMKGE